MRTIAKITAAAFILLGLLVVLLGIWFAVAGMHITQPSSPSLFPDFSGLLVLVRLVGGGAIGLQGLFLAAIGEGLWLVAGIHEQTQRTADLLYRLTRRNEQK